MLAGIGSRNADGTQAMRKRPYSLKPVPRFFGPGPHFGVELELEAPHEEAHDELLGSASPRCLYAKSDGSLSRWGIEIVTHPISLDSWLDASAKTPAKFFKLLAVARDLHCTSHDAGTCGMHVHVSRDAFAGDLHCYWFCRLFSGDLARRISQRHTESLCRWARQERPRVRRGHIQYPDSRYVSVAWAPATLEVRIFRGSLREDRVRKNLECVAAAIEFSHSLRAINVFPVGGLDAAWANYVMAYAYRYPNLSAYLVEIGAVAIPPQYDTAFSDGPVLVTTGGATCAS